MGRGKVRVLFDDKIAVLHSVGRLVSLWVATAQSVRRGEDQRCMFPAQLDELEIDKG